MSFKTWWKQPIEGWFELSKLGKANRAFDVRVNEIIRLSGLLCVAKTEQAASRKETECIHTHLFRGYCPKCTAKQKESRNE